MAILGAETITRKRYGPVTRGLDGLATFPSPTSTSIRASVQPAGGKVLETLDEGERTRDPRVVFSSSDLRPVDEATSSPADRLVVDGSDYEVRDVKVYRRGRLVHYRAVVLKVSP